MMIFLIIISEEDFEKLRLRDPSAFEKIYNEYKLKIYNFLIIKVNGNSNIAEEILSDTFYSALISSPGIKSKDKIASWLFQIANRRFYDYLRKKYKDDKINMEIIEQGDNNINNGKEANIENEKTVMLKSAIDNLNPKYKELIKLKYIDNKSQKEIAKILNKSRSSIENLLYRAREALKKEVKNLYKN